MRSVLHFRTNPASNADFRTIGRTISLKVTLRQLREADETLTKNVKTATYEAFQIMRREYEMKLLEEERRKRLEELRKERLGEDDETPSKEREKKLPGEEMGGKEREKKKAFFSRETKKGGSRIKTAETAGKNYETIRGESPFSLSSQPQNPMNRGNVETWKRRSLATRRTSWRRLVSVRFPRGAAIRVSTTRRVGVSFEGGA